MFDKIKFFKTKFEKRLLLAKINSHPSLKTLFKKKLILNEEINEEIEVRLKGDIENFVTILLIGEQGSIKSSCGQEFGKRTDQTFTAKNVGFLYESFKNKVSQSKAGQSFILDELVFLHGIGSQRIIEEIQTLIETLRKRKNSMIVICVENKYFSEDIFTFTMETIDKCLLGTCKKNKELHEIRSCKEKNHKIKKAYVRLAVKKKGAYIGFYIQEIIWNNKNWVDYEKQKDLFLPKVLKQDFGKLEYDKEAKKIIDMPESSEYKTIKQLKLFLEKKRPNLTVAEKDLLAEQIKIMRGKREGEE